jgi:protease-4
LAVVGGLVLVALSFGAIFGGSGLDRSGNIAVIDVDGVIHTGGGGLFAEGGASQPIMEQLREAGEDDGIKAVVLNINSPGGSAAASQAIAEEVRRLDLKKPVIAAMGDVAASGAYYIASSSRKIVANPATLTGSIGVVMEMMRYYGLMQKYGVEGESLTTGKYKDTGSPLRPMRPDEREYLNGMLQDTYRQFVADVAKGRKMDPAKVKALADGRVWTGAQALPLGLVDKLGNLYDAADLAAQLAGVKGKPKLRQMGRPVGLGALLAASSRLGGLTQMPLPAPPAAGGYQFYPRAEWLMSPAVGEQR